MIWMRHIYSGNMPKVKGEVSCPALQAFRGEEFLAVKSRYIQLWVKEIS